MIETIGFVSGVTLTSALLLFFPFCILMCILLGIVEWASRGRITYKVDTKKVDEDLLGSFVFASFIINLGLLIFVIIPGYTYIGVVTWVASLAAPVIGWVITVGFSLGFSALALRKIFDTYFNVKDKLNKLEKL